MSCIGSIRYNKLLKHFKWIGKVYENTYELGGLLMLFKNAIKTNLLVYETWEDLQAILVMIVPL